MDLAEAWSVFGRSLTAVMAEAKARPREERLAYLEGLLEEARRVKRALQGAHHPDRGGDPAMFKRVTDAFEVIEREFSEFRRAFEESAARQGGVPSGSKVRIRVDPIE